MQYMDTFKWTKGYGMKDKDVPDVSPDDDTIFRIGSVSKIFAVSCSSCYCELIINSYIAYLIK